MRRIAFHELPQAYLDLLLRAREDPLCEVTSVISRNADDLSLRMADVLGLPRAYALDEDAPGCDVLVAGDLETAPSLPGVKLVAACDAAADWEQVWSRPSSPAEHSAESVEPSPVRTWRRVGVGPTDLLGALEVSFRPHALAAWILSEACRQASASAGALVPEAGREGLMMETPSLTLAPESLGAWMSLPRVVEALVSGPAPVLLDEELGGDGRGPRAGMFVPFGDGGPYRGVLLLRAVDRFRTAELERLELWCRRAGSILAQSCEARQALREMRLRGALEAIDQAIEGSKAAEAQEAAAGALAEATGAVRAGLWAETPGGGAVGAGVGSATWMNQTLLAGRPRLYRLCESPTVEGEETWILVVPSISDGARGVAVLEDLPILPDEADGVVEDTQRLAAAALSSLARRGNLR